jgi:hypothetical protein
MKEISGHGIETAKRRETVLFAFGSYSGLMEDGGDRS